MDNQYMENITKKLKLKNNIIYKNIRKLSPKKNTHATHTHTHTHTHTSHMYLFINYCLRNSNPRWFSSASTPWPEAIPVSFAIIDW